MAGASGPGGKVVFLERSDLAFTVTDWEPESGGIPMESENRKRLFVVAVLRHGDEGTERIIDLTPLLAKNEKAAEHEAVLLASGKFIAATIDLSDRCEFGEWLGYEDSNEFNARGDGPPFLAGGLFHNTGRPACSFCKRLAWGKCRYCGRHYCSGHGADAWGVFACTCCRDKAEAEAPKG